METLDKHFRKLTAAAFQRHGFAQQDIASHWPQIAGPELARACVPERIRWPRGQAGDKTLMGGTLEVKAYAGRGLDVQHGCGLLVERVNQFLGHQAITHVKVRQSADMPPAPPARRAAPPTAPEPAGFDDPQLAAALARLESGIKHFNPKAKTRSPAHSPARSPQGR